MSASREVVINEKREPERGALGDHSSGRRHPEADEGASSEYEGCQTLR